MNESLISVCIPTYNNIVYLKKTLDSVVSQKNVNIEIVISDDSTTDDVKNLVEKYQSRYSNIIYFRNIPALGAPNNWNESISRSKGDYIKIMHHDEWFVDNLALYKYLEVINGKFKTIAFCSSYLLRGDKKQLILASDLELIKIRKRPTDLLFKNSFGSPSSLFISRKDLIEFDNNLTWLVDVEYYVRLLSNGFSFEYITAPLYCSVLDSHNITNECLFNTELQLEEYAYLYKKYLLKNNFFMKIYFVRIIYKILLTTYPKDKKILLLRLIKRCFK